MSIHAAKSVIVEFAIVLFSIGKYPLAKTAIVKNRDIPDDTPTVGEYRRLAASADRDKKTDLRVEEVFVLATYERYFKIIQAVHSDGDVLEILGVLALDFGFRAGGFLVEYGSPVGTDWRCVDTAGNEAWWVEFFASRMATDNPRFAALLAGSDVMTYDSNRFGPDESEAKDLAARGNFLDVALVPLSQSGQIIGALGLRGKVALSDQQRAALQFIAYNLFAQYRLLHGEPVATGRAALTRREREVIRLSAEGMTSQQIAAQLGMSARTANQHFDNVADKLGTRNRAHTVAEVIRRGLLD